MLALDPSIAMFQQSQMTQHDAVHDANAGRALTPAGLTASEDGKAIRIENAVTYLFGGVFHIAEAQDVPLIEETHDFLPDLHEPHEQVYLVSLDGDGNPLVTAGGATKGEGTAPLPERLASAVPIGYVRVTLPAGDPADEAKGFTAGKTALDAENVKAVYTDVGYYAPRFDRAQ